MTKNNISELSTTASSNGTIDDTDVSGATGKVKDGDNVMRSLARIMALAYDDFGGVNTVGGTANAITVTTPTLYTALATGMRVTFKAASTNTTTTTLNLDAIGAKAVRKMVNNTDAALVAGDIVAGRYYDAVYSTAANAAAGGWIITPSAIYLPDGTAAAPAITFDQDTDTGVYRIGSNNIGWAVNGAKALDLTAGLLAVPATSAGPSALALYEDTDNGTNKITLSAPSSVSADVTVTLPGVAGTIPTGPTSTTDNTLPRFDGTAGALQTSGVVVDDSNNVSSMGTLGVGAITTSGLLTTTSGQIKFPASQNASADANTLDDYEEGTYAPTITASSGTLTGTSGSAGSYVKIGRIVFFSHEVTITNVGTAAGFIRINLPFTPAVKGTVYGRETFSTGKMLQGEFDASGTYVSVAFYDNTFPGATNNVLRTAGFLLV